MDLSGYSNEQLLAMLGEQPQANPDAALGGTLQLGVPFTGMRFDTGVKLPPSVEAGLVGAGKTATRLLQGVNPFTNAQQVAEENRLYAPLEAAHPVATAVGESLPYFATANPAAMAGMAAAEYGTPGQRAERAGFAYAGGKIGQGVARLLGPQSMAPTANTLAADFFANAPNKYGIPLTVGQATGSKPAQIAESVLSNLPFGGAVNKARNLQFQAFNRAVSGTFGENASALTPELLGSALDRSGKQIGGILEHANVALDRPLAQDIANVSSLIPGMEDAAGSQVNRQITNLLGLLDRGSLTGQTLRKFDSGLGRTIGGTQNGDVRYAVGELQDALREAAGRSLQPAQNDALALARRQNFNVRQVANAIKSSPEGESISPKRLLSSVNTAQKGAKYGKGNDLAELAQFGASKLPDQIPNSGTAQRLFYQRLLTNPLAMGAGLLGAGYGAEKAGVPIPAEAAAAIPLVYLSAHGLAGQPASELTRSLLMRGGGLLGMQFSR